MNNAIGEIVNLSFKNNNMDLYESVKEYFYKKGFNDFHLVEKDCSIVLVSKDINEDKSRYVIVLIHENDYILKAGNVPSFLNISRSLQDKFMDYFDGFLYGLTMDDVSNKSKSFEGNIEIYAELAEGAEILNKGFFMNPYNVQCF